MRNLLHPDIDRWRNRSNMVLEVYGSFGDSRCGSFFLPLPSEEGNFLLVIASSDPDWEHVSVSLPDRCPTWEEMSFVKRTLFEPEEVVMQLHVAEDNHISRHNYCLHLWRPLEQVIPLPPTITV